jgi:predicted RNA-binding protein YlqC (UPF0109 family)
MKELVEYVVKALVDEPEHVEVREVAGERVVVIEVRVAPADVGKVIGREGRIANALRTIVKAAAVRGNLKASLEIIPPHDPPRR